MTSSALTRWALPVALIGSALLLSAFVFFAKLPEEVRVIDGKTGAAFLGTPGVALLIWLMLRGSAKASGQPDRSADLLIVWVLTFLFGVHAAILAAVIGMIPSLRSVIPSAVAILLLGLGPAIGTLAPGSPLGIRTASTLSDPDLWRRTHRLAGWLLSLSGVVGLVGARFGGPWALVAGVGPAIFGLIVALAYGSQKPRSS